MLTTPTIAWIFRIGSIGKCLGKGFGKTVMKFRKKPVIVEAMRIPQPGYEFREQGAKIEAWLRSAGCEYSIRPDAVLRIHTLEGVMEGRPGDWIICGVQGEFYPCKADIFEQTYEAVE
jgi:hypothetical protein